MKEIAKIESRGYTLTHSWLLDDWGLPKNHFELSKIRDDGMKMIYPFIGNIRVQNIDKGTAILGDDISKYEDFEYLEMLNEQVDKFNQSNP